MLCETCEKLNRKRYQTFGTVFHSIEIIECSTIDNDIHRRIYADECEEYCMLTGDGILHNPYGPALIEKDIDQITESWFYRGDGIESASILENKTIKTESGQIGVLLKLVEGKIHQVLIGDEKLLVVII